MKRLTESYKKYISRFPEELRGNRKGYPMDSGIVLEKLGAYEDLEEQGKLLKLPCAVGDTVYVLRIDNVEYMINGKKIWEIVEERFEMRHFDCMGKTVFTTIEEAEDALKELDKGE